MIIGDRGSFAWLSIMLQQWTSWMTATGLIQDAEEEWTGDDHPGLVVVGRVTVLIWCNKSRWVQQLSSTQKVGKHSDKDYQRLNWTFLGYQGYSVSIQSQMNFHFLYACWTWNLKNADHVCFSSSLSRFPWIHSISVQHLRLSAKAECLFTH